MHASSRLYRRLVVLATGMSAPGVTPSPVGSKAAAAFLPLLRGWKENHHEGTGAMLGRAEYAVLLRRLADEVLCLGVSTGGLLSTEATPEWLEVVAALYPDAELVDTPEQLRRDLAPLAPQSSGPALGESRLVVVLGCARSGTTWLEHMLMTHPLTGGLDTAESFVFYDLRKLWILLESLGFHAESVGLLRTHCDALFGAALARRTPTAEYFVEKTPLHALLVPMISELYPDAHYVHLIRDGRDVARSLADVEFYSDMDERSGARLWRQVLTEVRAAAPSLRHYRELTYESLVRDPVTGVGELLEWVGLEADEQVRHAIVLRAGERVSVHGSTGAVGPGKWSGMSRTKLAQVYEECGDLLVQEGYLSADELSASRTSRYGLAARMTKGRSK